MEEINRYEKYKDSGIEWIGEIPEHWETNKFNRIAFYQEGPGLRNWQFTTSGIKVICVTNIVPPIIDFSSFQKYISEQEYNDAYQHFTVNKGDLLLASSGASWGKVSEYKDDETVILNTSTIRLNENHSQKVSRDFIKWIIQSPYVFEQLNVLLTGSCQPNFGPSHLSQLRCVYPRNKIEQRKVSAYLNRKTTEIDQIIANKQKLITLYEEEKQAIINQAVTASIQENFTYKKTSTDWLDEIPDSWQFLAMKRLVSTKITDGPHETPEFFPDGVPFLSAESVKNGKLDFDFRRGNISKELDEIYSKKCKPKRDDIFIVKSGSTTGKIAIVDFDDDFNIWSPLALVRVNEKVKPYFLYYALQSFYFQKQIQLSWSFGTQPNIGMNVIENLKVAVPISLVEQESIISHIESELKRLNEIIDKFNKQIDLLQEYRTTLISEVVTGKIKVPNTIEA